MTTTSDQSAPLVILDCETDGLRPDRRPWEIAMIRREDGKRETCRILIEDVDLRDAEPFGLKVGRFYQRHPSYNPKVPIGDAVIRTERLAAMEVEFMTRGAHIVGAVPNFDTECLSAMLRRHGLCWAAHYHLIDIENLAVGYLRGELTNDEELSAEEHERILDLITPPWNSDDLARACGVEPPSDDERHTAMGDALMVERWWDTIMGHAAGGTSDA